PRYLLKEGKQDLPKAPKHPRWHSLNFHAPLFAYHLVPIFPGISLNLAWFPSVVSHQGELGRTERTVSSHEKAVVSQGRSRWVCGGAGGGCRAGGPARRGASAPRGADAVATSPDAVSPKHKRAYGAPPGEFATPPRPRRPGAGALGRPANNPAAGSVEKVSC